MTTAQRATLAAAVLGSAIVFLDGTFVYLALPRIGEELQSSLIGRLEGQTYVTSGYLATLAACLVLAGALGDFYGRRRVFLIGLAGFGLTSVLCGLAPNLELLVVGRLLQGVAGSLLVPGALSIITSTFEGESRGRAFGLWAGVTAALGTLGPPIGGVILETAGWRAMFLVNVPLVLAAMGLAWRWMRETRDEQSTGQFDWLGAGVAVLAIGGLAFGATRGQEGQWKEPVAFVALGVGGIATLVFPILMAKRPHPLVDLQLFRRRAFATINLSTLLIYGAMYTNFGFQALFLQGVLRYSPLGAAIVGLPTGILLTLISPRIGAIAGRLGARPFLAAGPVLMSIGFLWMVTVGADSVPWQATLDNPGTYMPPVDALLGPFVAALFFGSGVSMMVAPLTTTLMGSVPVRNAGVASAINNALSRVGQPLVAAAVFVIVSGTFYSSLAAAVPGTDPASADLRAQYQPLNPPPKDANPQLAAAAKEASTDAFHLAVMVGAGLLLAGAAVNWVGLRPGDDERSKVKADAVSAGPPASG